MRLARFHAILSPVHAFERLAAPCLMCLVSRLALGPLSRVSMMTIKAVVFDAYGTLYDIQSVAAVTEQAFPGYGEAITQIWRMKQLEYTWLRSLMQRYEDFSVVTRESLRYTLDALGLAHDAATLAPILDKYLHLDPYPDAKATLAALKGTQARDPVERRQRHARCAGRRTAVLRRCWTRR